MRSIPRIFINLVFEGHGGQRCIMEVQLHLNTIYVQASMNHVFYEITRAKDMTDVLGTAEKEKSNEKALEREKIFSQFEGLFKGERRRLNPYW